MTRSDIVSAARSWIGTPYRHQASLKGIGCDCLGLLRGIWREVVGPEPERPPPYARDWAEGSGREALFEAACRHLTEPRTPAFCEGDVLLFRPRAGLPARHCAIATSADTMVHAHDGASVAEVAVAPWWDRRIARFFSFPGLDP